MKLLKEYFLYRRDNHSEPKLLLIEGIDSQKNQKTLLFRLMNKNPSPELLDAINYAYSGLKNFYCHLC